MAAGACAGHTARSVRDAMGSGRTRTNVARIAGRWRCISPGEERAAHRRATAPRYSTLLPPGCCWLTNAARSASWRRPRRGRDGSVQIQLQNDEGPCLDCYLQRPCRLRLEPRDRAHDRWPLFAREAVAAGFQSVHALPMRLREQCIGTLNLFRVTAGPLNQADVCVGQALADVATIGILQERAVRRSEVLAVKMQIRAEQSHRHRAGQGHAGRACSVECAGCVRRAAQLRPRHEPAAVRRRPRSGYGPASRPVRF